MHKSKLYDMAGEIAMDKLMPKPVEITISMRGGGGISSLNENIVYRQGGGPPGTKLWNDPETGDPDLPMAEYKVNHNGGLSLMMKGDDGRFYTRGGTDQRGLYYPEEVREQSVSDEPALHPADEEDSEITTPRLGKAPRIPVESINLPAILGSPRKLTPRFPAARVSERPVFKNISDPSLPPDKNITGSGGLSYDDWARLHSLGPYKQFQSRRDEAGTLQVPPSRFTGTPRVYDQITGDISIPQPEGGGDSRKPDPFRTGSPYPYIDPFIAQEQAILRKERGEDDWRGQGDLAPGPLFPQGTDDPRGINEDFHYIDTDFTGFGMKHGGGISSLNDSININGQPHRLVWANPQEERVLKKMGGSGRKVLGKPAYYYGSYGADPWDITEDMTAEDINIGMESGDISTYGMGDTDIDPQAGSDFSTAMSLYDPKEYSKMYKGIDDVYTEAGTERVAPITFAELGATRKQDAGARRRFINQHLANYPGGRRDPVTQELFEADKDYDRAIKKYGSSMLQTLRDSYAGNQDVFGAMFRHATKLAQDRLREAYNKEIDKFPEDFVDSEEYRESIVDAVLSDPNKAFEKFGLTDVTKSKSFLPEAKVGERGWRDWLGELATPLAVRGLDALAGGIPALLNIWGTGKVNGEGVYIKKDGTLIPFKSDTERGNIESGSLRGENVVPKKLKRRPVQVASTKEVIEEESTPLERLLASRSKVSPLAQLNEEMQERVNRLYNRNIFT